ncbi:MAG: hypothetical protein H8E57_08010 [Candidatus Cloacimonetes bacterium]|nr:hypothetical protein [Candidatus Cloacimonadota bacterium]
MARRTFRINIPFFKPDALIKLAELILSFHKNLGMSSPLTIFDMDKFAIDLETAVQFRKQSIELKKESKLLMQKSKNLLGMESKQTSYTKGTILNLVMNIRDLLLALNKGDEKALGDWGFEVVIGTTQPYSKKKKDMLDS